jgi:hypothetical protein
MKTVTVHCDAVDIEALIGAADLPLDRLPDVLIVTNDEKWGDIFWIMPDILMFAGVPDDPELITFQRAVGSDIAEDVINRVRRMFWAIQP